MMILGRSLVGGPLSHGVNVKGTCRHSYAPDHVLSSLGMGLFGPHSSSTSPKVLIDLAPYGK